MKTTFLRQLCVIILTISMGGCINVRKTKIGTVTIKLEENKNGTVENEEEITLGSLSTFDPSRETLDLTLRDAATNIKVNLHLDNKNSTRDTVQLLGTIINSNKDTSTYFLERLPVKMFESFVIEKINYDSKSVTLVLRDEKNPVDTARQYSLKKYLRDAAPFTVSNLKQKSIGSDFMKTYSATLTDRFGNRSEAFASTDPVPLIVYGVIAAYALYQAKVHADKMRDKDECIASCTTERRRTNKNAPESKNAEAIYNSRGNKIGCDCNDK